MAWGAPIPEPGACWPNAEEGTAHLIPSLEELNRPPTRIGAANLRPSLHVTVNPASLASRHKNFGGGTFPGTHPRGLKVPGGGEVAREPWIKGT